MYNNYPQWENACTNKKYSDQGMWYILFYAKNSVGAIIETLPLEFARQQPWQLMLINKKIKRKLK